MSTVQELNDEKSLLLIKCTRLSKKMLELDLGGEELLEVKRDYEQKVSRVSAINKELDQMERTKDEVSVGTKV